MESEPIYYHVYNRGVDKRTIFEDESDYLRFLGNLENFNKIEIRGQTSDQNRFVDIVCFCLMPNHYHLLLSPKVENGLTDFMRKISTGYTMYFNDKHDRSGVLFESNYKSIIIDKDAYLIHLSRYIHLNPIGLIEHNDGEKISFEKVNEFLGKYRWSSYQDYIGLKKMPQLNGKFVIENTIGKNRLYKDFIKEWYLYGEEVIENKMLFE